MKIAERKKGMTLVEAVVYIAITVILIVGIVGTVVFVIRTLGDLKASRDVRNSAVTVLERIGRDLRQAESVNGAASSFDSHPGNVLLNTGGTPGTIEFYIESGGIKVREDGVYLGDLTLLTVTVTNLIFRQTDTTNSEGVKVEITLQNNDGTVVNATSFYTSGVLRGSYQ